MRRTAEGKGWTPRRHNVMNHLIYRFQSTAGQRKPWRGRLVEQAEVENQWTPDDTTATAPREQQTHLPGPVRPPIGRADYRSRH